MFKSVLRKLKSVFSTPRHIQLSTTEEMIAEEIGVDGLMEAFRSKGARSAAFFAEYSLAGTAQYECSAETLPDIARHQTQRRLLQDWQKTVEVITKAAQKVSVREDFEPAMRDVTTALKLDPNNPRRSVPGANS